MALFTTALGHYGGVLWSGELQGFILHEMVPPTCSQLGTYQAAGPQPVSAICDIPQLVTRFFISRGAA
jgi:hypothetical protein